MFAAALGALWVNLLFGVVGGCVLDPKEAAVTEAIHAEMFLPPMSKDILVFDVPPKQNNFGFFGQPVKIIIENWTIKHTTRLSAGEVPGVYDDGHRGVALLFDVDWRRVKTARCDGAFGEHSSDQRCRATYVVSVVGNFRVPISIYVRLPSGRQNEQTRPLRGDNRIRLGYGSLGLGVDFGIHLLHFRDLIAYRSVSLVESKQGQAKNNNRNNVKNFPLSSLRSSPRLDAPSLRMASIRADASSDTL